MHHYFQTEITLENLIWAARRQGFISYQRLNQAQGIADQNWSIASSLLIRHLDQLASKSHRDGKPVFSFLAVARKELATGKHTKRRHRQIIRAFGDRAPAEEDIVAFIKKEQMRCFAWGHGEGLADTGRKTGGCTAPASPQCRSSGRTAASVVEH